MQRHWLFRPWLPYKIGLDKMARHCSIANGMELLSAGTPIGQFLSDFPVAQLKLTLKSFDIDCFMWESRTFVSERMRQAMALESSAVQFFDVDSSQSEPLPRSMNYKLMWIPVVEDVSDPSKSGYMNLDMPGGVTGKINVQKIAVRAGFESAHALFYDRFFFETFCTDEFALRVLRAGCTGMRFFDPEQLSLAMPMRFRTLQGIEEEGEWDPVRKIEHTKLVEAIH